MTSPKDQAGRDGFAAMLAHYKDSAAGRNNVHYEERDGDHRPWPELSPTAKLGYIARDAVLSGVPFERFAAAVNEFLHELPPPARQEAALRLALDYAHELHQLAKLLPDHGRLESYPLVEQLRDTLDFYREWVAERQTDEKLGKALKELVPKLTSPAQLEQALPTHAPPDHAGGTLAEQLFAAAPLDARPEKTPQQQRERGIKP